MASHTLSVDPPRSPRGASGDESDDNEGVMPSPRSMGSGTDVSEDDQQFYFDVHPTVSMPAKHAREMVSILRWCHARGVLDAAALSGVLNAMDQFVEPEEDSASDAAGSLALSATSAAQGSTSSVGDADDEMVSETVDAADLDDDGDESDPDLSDLRQRAVQSLAGRVRKFKLERSDTMMMPKMTSSEKLEMLAATINHPIHGVRVGRVKRTFRTYHNVCVGRDCVDWMLEKAFAASRQEAVELGGRLIRHGFLHKASSGSHFHDNQALYRFSTRTQTIRQRAPRTQCQHACSILHLAYSVHEDRVVRWVASASREDLWACYPPVILWTVNHPEYENAVRSRMEAATRADPALNMAVSAFLRANESQFKEKVGEAKVNECMNERPSLSPEADATISLVADAKDGIEMVEAIRKAEAAGTRFQHPFVPRSGTIRLNKAFSSSARPAWCSILDDKGEPIGPDVIAKTSDDLRKDNAVQTVFAAFEAVWNADSGAVWTLGTPPTVARMRVLVTSEKSGFIEFVRGKTVREVAVNNEWKNINLRRLAPSIVGSLCAGFVLGVRDRHSDNLMVVGDPQKDPRLLNIDFGYLLMEAPGGFAMDTPRLTLQPQLIKLLKRTPGHNEQSTLLDDLRADLKQAYFLLREQHPALVSFTAACLSAVYPVERVESFCWGRHAFRSGMDREKVMAWFEEKINTQLSSGVVVRRGAKQALVNAYLAVRGGL